MNKFHDGSQLVVVSAAVAIGIGHQQNQYRTYAFATGADDVLGDLIDQRDFRVKFLAYHGIDGIQISCDGLYKQVLSRGGGSGNQVEPDYK